jgi:hypothetical protein
MYLVVCSETDLAGIWAYENLLAVGLAPLSLVTLESLASTATWEHRIGSDGAHLKIELKDGRRFCSSQIRGVLNRTLFASPNMMAEAVEQDREYANNEIVAFYLSWLHLLPGVINRPSPLGLAGSWQHNSQSSLLAGRAGLTTSPYHQSAATPMEAGFASLAPPGADITHHIVLRRNVYSDPYAAPLPQDVADACIKFAALCKTDLLGIDLSRSDSGPLTFAGVTPHPNLVIGGLPLINALAACLRSAA